MRARNTGSDIPARKSCSEAPDAPIKTSRRSSSPIIQARAFTARVCARSGVISLPFYASISLHNLPPRPSARAARAAYLRPLSNACANCSRAFGVIEANLSSKACRAMSLPLFDHHRLILQHRQNSRRIKWRGAQRHQPRQPSSAPASRDPYAGPAPGPFGSCAPSHADPYGPWPAQEGRGWSAGPRGRASCRVDRLSKRTSLWRPDPKKPPTAPRTNRLAANETTRHIFNILM